MILDSGAFAQQSTDHGGPGFIKISTVIAASAEAQQAPVALPVRQVLEPHRCVTVGCAAIFKMGYGVAIQAVCATLKQNELPDQAPS